ncbi:gamma-glutamylcyclotransferase family protein [Kitasatospora sp. NPDC088346]|uniref:gamma-glutamylcyclotransferase family protein n=1 Tax=Kitasatospora sp. NPDC088346 TaxID=3364073 RepID=UPI00381F9F00
MTEPTTHQLFSYGTLQRRDVQLARFGRVLEGRPDALPGHRTTYIAITDPEVIAVSGGDRHPLVLPSPDPADVVKGTVLTVSEVELAAADEHEVAAYARVAVVLRSGERAWAYLDAAAAGR